MHQVHSVDVECGREYICEVWRGKRWRNKDGIEWLGMGLVLIKRNLCNLKIKHSQTIKMFSGRNGEQVP